MRTSVPSEGAAPASVEDASFAAVCPLELIHRVYGAFDEARHIKDAWDEFAAREGDVFCTFDWYETWWRHFGDGRRLEIHVFRDGEELVAILPLLRHTLWLAGIPLRMVQLVGCDHAVAMAGLAIQRAHIKPVMQKLVVSLTRTGPWNVLHLGPLGSYAANVPDIGHSCAAMPEVDAVIIGNRDGCQTVYSLPSTYEQYLRCMPGSERRNLGRCERQLAAEHEVELLVPRTADDVEETLERLIDLHQALWKAKGRLGQFEEWPGFESFHRDMCRGQLEAGRLVLVQLNIDGRAVGVECGYAFGSRVHAVIRGYKPGDEWNRYSLGRMLHCGAVQQAIDGAAKLLDDGGGAFEYKHRLGGELGCTRSVVIVRRGAGARQRLWLAMRGAYFMFGFCRRIWIYKLRRLGFRERPIRKKRLRAGFLADLFIRSDLSLFGRRRVFETHCADGLRRLFKRPGWCPRPPSTNTRRA
jgi:CelD/BcsL family acetyltransferase involved in cellulose biosynthesis